MRQKAKLAVILGGQGKGQNFAELAKPLMDYAQVVYFIGEDADKIAADLASAGLDSHNSAGIVLTNAKPWNKRSIKLGKTSQHSPL